MSIANIKRYAMRNIKLKPMAQQTAVEWLIEKVQNKELEIVYTDIIHSVQIPIHIIKQAKQMEKEQLMKAYKAHHDLGHIYGLEAEQYYNETYKKIVI